MTSPNQILQMLADDCEREGWHKEWRRAHSLVFHKCSYSGKIIWPGEFCMRKWDGSGYDPEWIWRKII